MKRTLLIINPISGTLSKEGLAMRVCERLAPAGFEIEAVETEYAGHGSELARAAMREGYQAHMMEQRASEARKEQAERTLARVKVLANY